MSGIDLATIMTADRPELKVLPMSGFPGGMPVLNEGWHFLAKPFVSSQLRALVTGLIFPNRGSAKFSNEPDRCPVYRTLKPAIAITTELVFEPLTA
jgi:hypothetical protein